MDRLKGSLQPPIEGIAPGEGCRSCALLHGLASQNRVEGTAFVAEIANEDAVVLSGPTLAGLVVIPRKCVSGLEDLPSLRRAEVLAAVRRATLLVRQGSQMPTSRIVAMTDSSAPAGHVSFQVLPNEADDPTDPASWSPPTTLASLSA
jgi:diadenosine tetraphosphate (Ap4A) HIT family hydrolase